MAAAAGKALPEGWTEVFDPDAGDRGETCYIHEKTGRVLKQHPADVPTLDQLKPKLPATKPPAGPSNNNNNSSKQSNGANKQPRPPAADGKRGHAPNPSIATDALLSDDARKAKTRMQAELLSVDRWGNVRDPNDNDPSAPSAPLKGRAARKQAKRKRELAALDRKREGKWIKMTSQWAKFIREKPKVLKRRVRKGIPDSLRALVWPRLTGSLALMERNPGKYQRLLQAQCPEFDDVIKRDLHRTFPTHVLFRVKKGMHGDEESEESMGRKALFNVLHAYAVFDKEVGYCQGMGFLAGIFLMYMREEEAFWLLRVVLRGELYNFWGLYAPGFPLLKESMFVFTQLMKSHCPKVAKHLEKEGMLPDFYATQWFITLFSYNMPFDVTLRLWDIIMLEGSKAIFRFAIYILKYHRKAIMKSDFAALNDILKKVHEGPMVQDATELIEGVLSVDITRAQIAKLRKKYQQQKAAEGGANGGGKKQK